MRRPALLPALLLAACGEEGPSRWEKRQAAVDPPILWRVEVVDGGAPSNPVQVCADSIMAKGFAEPTPAFGGRRCEPLGGEHVHGVRRSYICSTESGKRYAVASAADGDLARDFTVRFSVRPLGSGAAYSQTRRYQMLGRCPEGWRVGNHTDQGGRRRADARWE